jgi:exodeoxyribonuclease V beta subunit
MTGTAVFDVCGPLPTGMTVLEASAGTGKTFTIAALAARYVAEGVPLSELLLVTFTRMATGELRDRVRQRLASAERGLARALHGMHPDPDDSVLCLLADGSPAQVEERRRRLAAALTNFDAATIATIHQFCDQVLGGLGIAGDTDPDMGFLEDDRDLVDEVIDDLYVRRFHGVHGAPKLTRAQAQEIGRLAVDKHDAVLEPRDPASEIDAMRVRLAEAVRAELAARKRRAGVLTYDDLLTRLRDTLEDPERGPQACERLRARYSIALIDEFQDTDPVQWAIFARVFGDATLVLIGDPKQAIYAFRGADVHTYLAAASSTEPATLSRNQRSDQPLLDAFDALFDGATLGHPGIVYRTVEAAPGHEQTRLAGAPVPAPLRVRLVDREAVGVTDSGCASPDAARAHIAADLAADVARLLSARPLLVDRDRSGAERGRRQVEPGDVAVLVHRHRDAAAVCAALADAGIPAVMAGAGSVFWTAAAWHWLRLLEALERPTAPTRARTAALTPFIGWTAAELAAADEAALEAIHARFHRWAGVLTRRGVAALQETVTVEEGLPARLLAVAGGERILTDLRHLGELLHAEGVGEQLGPTALAAWLRQRMREADRDAGAEDRSRRLETDADAVQVLTIHRSKGLEFPIVYCPYLWDTGYLPKDTLPVYHDPDHGGRRTLDVAAGRSRRWRLFAEEERGEDLRLAYVALTRARHQAVMWWAGTYPAAQGALTRLLFARDEAGVVAAFGPDTPSDEDARARFAAVAARAPGCVSVEDADADDATFQSDPREAAALEAARFGRRLDAEWRRTSYTGIAGGRHDPRVASEAEVGVKDDEAPLAGDATVPATPEEAVLRTHPSLLAGLPGGAAVGTLVHRILEGVDFTAADLPAALSDRLAEVRGRRDVDLGDPGPLVEGLAAALRTPLGDLASGIRLTDLAPADRLDELAFELPLCGGDEPAAGGRPTARVEDLGDLLDAHLPPGDPLAGYGQRLRAGLPGALRGYLAGSIDLVARLKGDGAPRYLVADYKTNWLGVDAEPLTLWHYRPSALADAMQRAHYPLQALLYAVALHRYLRWRQPGYDPAVHLAGVAYLFLRGMAGADAPTADGAPAGVFSWAPPPALVTEASDLLDRGTA